MKKIINIKKIFYSVLFIYILLLFSDDAIAQVPPYIPDNKTKSYKDRLIDYADIYNYEINPQTKDTILYIRKINDYWYGIFGSANFGLSFGNFKSLVDPKNQHNIFNAIIDFYSQFGTGYTFGLMGEWAQPTTDFSFGLKLGAFDRKISNVATEYVSIETSFLDGDYDFNAKLTYLTLNPYVKYTFPQFNGFFVTAGADVSIAYSSTAYLERSYVNTGDIYHKMDMSDIKGNTRFLINLGIGYDFFIADFFAAKNRVRITPFLDFKGGTNIITSGGSNWNDITLNAGLQIKLAPDKVTIDTLIYDPTSEIPIDYIADIRNEIGFEFPGFTGFADPPLFELAVITLGEQLPEPEDVDMVFQEINTPVEISAQPQVSVSPAISMTVGTVNRIGGFATSTATTLTPEMREQYDQIINYLKANPNFMVRVEGHSDNRGTRAQNESRATARTNAVVNYFVSQGISRNRILHRGRGSNFPLVPNTSEANVRRNRRVEVTILPP